MTVLSGATELPPIPPRDGDLRIEPEVSRESAEATHADAVRLNRSELWFIIPTFCGNSPARRPDLPRTDHPTPGTTVVPAANSVRTEFIIQRSRSRNEPKCAFASYALCARQRS